MKKAYNLMQIIGGGEYFGKKFPIGGAAEYVFSLTEGLDSRRFRTVFVFLQEGPTARKAREEGYPVYVVSKKLWKDPSIILRLSFLMKKEKIDIVNTHISNADFFGRIAGRIVGVKGVITTMHSFIFGTMAHLKERKILESINYWQEMVFSSLNHKIILTCEALRKDFIRWGVNDGKMVTIHAGIDLKKFSPNTDKLTIRRKFNIKDGDLIVGTVGRLSPVKNLPLFFRIANRLKEKIPNVKFLIVGDGPLKGYLKERAKKEGILKETIFTGWVDKIEKLISIFDVFLLTSDTETGCIAVIEAMACGKPVVSTGVGGVPEVIENGANGYLYKVGDHDVAVHILSRLLKNKQLCTRIGRQARGFVKKNYSIVTMAKKTEELYEELLS